MGEAGICWTELADLHYQVGDSAEERADIAGCQSNSADSSPDQRGNGRIRADEGVDDERRVSILRAK
jgi:hypothetical protein